MCRFSGKKGTPVACLFFLATLVLPVRAFEIWSDEDRRQSVALDVAGKFTSLLSRGPDDPILFPERNSETSLLRLRLDLNVKHNDWMNSEIAYEQRARWVSEAAGFGATGRFLPAEAEAPFRLTQLDWQLCEEPGDFVARHEVDRALVALHPEWGEVTIGRQAIGLGRGVLFGAVDVFNPFSPLEVDREWRRGVDAVRAEYRVSQTSSVEVIGAFAETWEKSALLGRFRGYVGNVDASLITGKRGQDFMLGVTTSAAVGDAEIHGELAIFDTPEPQPDSGWFGDDHLVGKAVAGGSYTFDIGKGLTLLGEYHYCGFGVKDASDATARLMDPTFRERFLRGDMQVLGRHAMATQLSYPLTDALDGSFLVLQSPVDGSGVVSPSIRWDLAEDMSLIASAFIPWGDEPAAGQLDSEYGATPVSFVVQLNVYR